MTPLVPVAKGHVRKDGGGDWSCRFSLGLDAETAETIRRLAIADQVSFAQKTRELIEWGLEAVSDPERRVA